jgi:ribonuclease-3
MSDREAHDRRSLEDRLGYEFRDRSLLDAALTHASAMPPGIVRAGERLEFLGDAVLALVTADLLLKAFAGANEGELSKRRAQLVRTSTLAAKARELGLDEEIRLGRGEDRSGGREKASILAACYEALIGAVFLDGGLGHAHAVVARHFAPEIAGSGRALASQDWKTLLQERTQAAARVVPEYRVIEEKGPAHARQFTAEVYVAGKYLARGEGRSKRAAEQQAAKTAYRVFTEASDS